LLGELNMTNSLLIFIIISMVSMVEPLSLHIDAVFAMHDSTLDVNTWIASDNTTQLHTIDLNKGVQSPSVGAGAITTPEETADGSTEDMAAADANGDKITGSDRDESDNESSIEDENGG
jgi:hypothetical protein